MGVKLKSVQCITPATGIERTGVIFGGALTAHFESVAVATGVGAVFVPDPISKTVLGITAGISAGLGVVTGGVTGLVSLIDSDRSPDQLYIKVNGRKVWPSEKYQEVKALKIVRPNLEIPLILSPDFSKGFLNAGSGQFVSQGIIQLWEYDSASKDDSLGFLIIRKDDLSKGIHTIAIGNSKEDSQYLLEIEIT